MRISLQPRTDAPKSGTGPSVTFGLPYSPADAPQANAAPKSNPFGAARPVDTQKKLMEVEQKIGAQV
jgi:hypothetical protein